MDPLKLHARQLHALGHPARLAILRQVVQAGPDGLTTTELQERVKSPWTTLHHHLHQLVRSNLVEARRNGRVSRNTANFSALGALTDFLWKDCCKRGRVRGCR